MRKYLKLSTCLFLNCSYLFKTKLTGQHYALSSHFHKTPCGSYSCHCHLCAHMQLQLRVILSDKAHHTQILHYNAVKPLICIRPEIVSYCRKLRILKQGVKCHKDSDSSHVTKVQSLKQHVFLSAFRICTCRKKRTAHINSIGPCIHCRPCTVKRPCRCKQLTSVLSLRP